MNRRLMSWCMVTWAVSILTPTNHLVVADTIRIGSKNFTEQEILGELLAQLIELNTDLDVDRRFGLGGTGICHRALVSGQIDLYAEYTGTALLNVLKRQVVHNPYKAFNIVALAYRDQFDLEWLPPIGFNNTYAIAIRQETAERNHWQTISDLRAQTSRLRAAFTGEFIERPDGYPGLRSVYGLEFLEVIDLDPGLMYQALAAGEVDVICAFATDGRISAYDLVVLEDDRACFPPYDACPVVRGPILRKYPELRDVLAAVAGTIDAQAMRKLNYAVDEQGKSTRKVAHQWLEQIGAIGTEGLASGPKESDAPRAIVSLLYARRGEIMQKTLQHILLTVVSTLIAIVIAIPLGVWIHRHPRASSATLALAEVIQTIPSLAMLAFLFALYGVLGVVPAVTALVLYALLPIVLNTYTGLREVPAAAREAADAVGMSNRQKLWIVELPLALPMIIAGVRTAAVWSVGIATLSTFIGAGGLGDFISRGLARDDAGLTLLGAVPAALIALALSYVIKRIETSMKKW